MAFDIEARFEGLDGVLKRLRDAGPAGASAAGSAIRAAATLVAKDAKMRARALDDPKTARKIFNNIKVRSRKLRNGDRSANVFLPTKVALPTPHWSLLEFGTSQMAARPFMRPALEQNITGATNKFIEIFNKRLDRILAKLRK